MRNFFYRLVAFSQRHAWLIIAATAVITIVLGWFAVHIKPDPDAIMTVDDPEVTRLTEKYGETNQSEGYLIVMASGAELFTPRALGLLSDAYDRLAEIPLVHAGLTAFSFPAFQNQGGRLGFGTAAEGGRPPRRPRGWRSSANVSRRIRSRATSWCRATAPRSPRTCRSTTATITGRSSSEPKRCSPRSPG